MWSTRTRRTAAVVLGLGCGAFAAGPTGAFAGPHHHATASKHPHGKGFYVADQTKTMKVTSSTALAALVEDGDGNRHVVTTAKAPSASGNQGHLVYYTRASGKHTRWKSHNVHGLRPLAGIQIEDGLSTDGRRVWAVIFQCDGVYVADASLKTTRLPVPTLVQSADTCADPQPASADPPVAKAVPEFGHRVGILLPDPSQLGQPTIWTGKPGSAFTPGPALPTSDSFVPEQIAFDPSGSDLTAVGEGTDGLNKAIYVTTLRASDSDWSSPTLIATMNSPIVDYQIESITAFGTSRFVGVSRSPDADAGKPGVFIVHGTRSGQWGGVIRLPHTTAKDRSLRLLYNTETGHLHAAFTRHGPHKKAGILQQARVEHGWSHPKYYSHSAHDVAQQITINPAGRAVIGYLHK